MCPPWHPPWQYFGLNPPDTIRIGWVLLTQDCHDFQHLAIKALRFWTFSLSPQGAAGQLANQSDLYEPHREPSLLPTLTLTFSTVRLGKINLLNIKVSSRSIILSSSPVQICLLSLCSFSQTSVKDIRIAKAPIVYRGFHTKSSSLSKTKLRISHVMAPSHNDWLAIQQILFDAWLGGKPLNSEFINHMKEIHGFSASSDYLYFYSLSTLIVYHRKGRYERNFREWGWRKNLTEDEMQYVLIQIKTRKERGKESEATLAAGDFKIVIPQERIRKRKYRSGELYIYATL